MARGKTLKVAFKQNHQHQLMVFPPNLDELVGSDHPVRVVNTVLDKLDISSLVDQYKPGGTSSYHPRMLLKVLVYAYINNIYSSRKIEEALQQNIYFMWIAGMSRPDHNTINRFRGQRLQKALQPIFTQVVLLLCEEGVMSIKDLYTDGTKIEANASRYTCVWGKSVEKNKQKITQQLNELWQYAQQVAASEMDDTDPTTFTKIDAEKVSATIEKINEALKDKKVSNKVRQQLDEAKSWPAELEKCEEQEKILGTERSGYSKTDPDATIMRMKNDDSPTGQPKPAYNVQISTNSQYIGSYSIHQNSADTTTLISHLSAHEQQYKELPDNLIADAGYGSHQNYKWLKDNEIQAFVKSRDFDRSQNAEINEQKPYSQDKLPYDSSTDQFTCPAGQPMKFVKRRTEKTKTGFEQEIRHYQAQNCQGCPLRSKCHKAKGNRIIHVNLEYTSLRKTAEELLKSEEGIKKRKQRCFDVEPVFGNIKNNHQFNRFMLRGKAKVEIEIGLLALAHNLRKKAA
ncbi:MAG: IS1182 family transposase [Gemmatimonadaceae bacterium]|nr:IS1182 family transposase [Chitinophagaceae bacterium]